MGDISCKNNDADFIWLFKECSIPVSRRIMGWTKLLVTVIYEIFCTEAGNSIWTYYYSISNKMKTCSRAQLITIPQWYMGLELEIITTNYGKGNSAPVIT
jgi:hypothetical protein